MTERTNEAAVGAPTWAGLFGAAPGIDLTGEDDVLCETLADFARWQGESDDDAAWAAETFLRERTSPPAHPNPEPPTGDGEREGVGRRG